MRPAEFVHLRVHSAYSLAEGAIRLPDLVKRTAALAMPAVAVTDTGNLFGALEFAGLAASAGVQPIVGCSLGLKRPEGERPAGRPHLPPKPDRIGLLVQSEAGYRNLMALVSRAHLDGAGDREPEVDWPLLADHADGLIALTGGLDGPVARPLAEGAAPAQAGQALADLAKIFPGRLYVEVMRHDRAVERRIEPDLIRLAYEHDLPLVATNDAFFLDPDMHEAHDVLLCIAEGAYQGQEDRRRVTPQHWFKPAADMRALFADLPEAVDNTLVIARRCAFMPEGRAPILPHMASDETGEDEPAMLRRAAEAGLEARLAAHVLSAEMDADARAAAATPYRERLDFELSVIAGMGYAGYFLIVADFIQWAKKRDIPVGPGRGSGAASVVAWALTITDLDPLKLGLLFERFLNPERVSMPDFDIDFCQDRRDEVIHYVQERYGADRVAQIITFGKMQARAVLRDVGRVLQMPYGQVDRICKLVPNNPAKPTTLGQALETVDQLREERDQDEQVAYLIAIALKLEGLFRHASTHAAGVVIGDRPLQELVPLYRDPRSDMPVTQFSMYLSEKAGLVKFDFLGLKTLTVLQQAVALIAKTGGPHLQLDRLPLDDAATYAMLSQGETTGVFQLESSGMRDILRRMKIGRFEEIIALVALYRPGPMDNIPTYIKVKTGEQPVDYLHPTLEPYLAETFGIMIYQEQVMQVAQVLAGYSLGNADLLRRAMGKKIQSEMDAQRETFVDGARARGVAPAQAAGIFDQVAKFAGYGFNKAHAAAYALVAYQTAYLKANHPVAFFAALMNLDLANTDKLDAYRQELRRLGIPLLPPDINASEALFAVETDAEGGPAIRYALAALKGASGEAMRQLAAERAANGPYKDVYDMVLRADMRALNRRQLETLARAGAFDRLEANRCRLFEGVDMLMRIGHAAQEDRESHQTSLFAAADAPDYPELPAVADWDPIERLNQEHEAIGLYFSAHPIDSYPLQRVGARPYVEATRGVRPGTSETALLAGIVLGRREAVSRSDKRYAFVRLSDASASFEVTVFSEVLATGRRLLDPGTPVLVTAEIQCLQDGTLRLTAQGLDSLDGAVERAAMAFEIHVETEAALPHLAALLAREGRGRSPVHVRVRTDWSQEVEVKLPGGYALGPRSRAALKAIAGIADVRTV